MLVFNAPYPGTGVTGFAPSSLGSLVSWYDAQTLSGANGSAVLTFPDTMGANNATGGNGVNPTLTTSGLTGIGGKQAIGFFGSSGSLTVGNTLLVGATSGSFFTVFQRLTDPPGSGREGAIFDGFTNDVSGSKNSHHPYSDGVIYEHFGASTRQTVGNPTPDLSTSFRIYSAHSAASDFRTYLDGTLLFSTASNTVDFGSGVTKYIGQSQGGTNAFNGYIAEILAFNNSLTTSDRQKVEGYLAWKYSMTANLPGGHPYKAVAP